MEERIKTLEEEIHATGEELREILLDIRSFLMEAHNPLQAKVNVERVISQAIQGRK